MSGIVGIHCAEGAFGKQEHLKRMVESLVHRGPDGSGVWSGGPVCLGHRMLHTTPESLTEQLPLVNETGDLVLTADARIDNREELIRVLGVNGTAADSLLILKAYE